jgi:hypothetical protein
MSNVCTTRKDPKNIIIKDSFLGMGPVVPNALGRAALSSFHVVSKRPWQVLMMMRDRSFRDDYHNHYTATRGTGDGGDISSCRRHAGGWTGVRGHDITSESLEWGDRPKVIITGYAASGFDVQNTVKRVVGLDPEEQQHQDGTVHYQGSILVFPYGCFLWNVESIHDVTVETLAPVVLHRPKLEYVLL